METEYRDSFPNRYEWVAIVCAVLPFFITLGVTRSSGENIAIPIDPADILLGGFLIWRVWQNLIFIREGEAKYKTIRIILTAVLLLVAAFHIASGLGLLISLPAPLGFGS